MVMRRRHHPRPKRSHPEDASPRTRLRVAKNNRPVADRGGQYLADERHVVRSEEDVNHQDRTPAQAQVMGTAATTPARPC
ncbi:hypothetical protein PC123_g18083 [Phytophthora cactorum]|nr:hypothetical protein PC120_g17620 [Phytophthora cactorum]KAG4046539.1 hypothetical protein PC123_g18083 [Phytophthora cactorum]